MAARAVLVVGRWRLFSCQGQEIGEQGQRHGIVGWAYGKGKGPAPHVSSAEKLEENNVGHPGEQWMWLVSMVTVGSTGPLVTHKLSRWARTGGCLQGNKRSASRSVQSTSTFYNHLLG